MYVIFYFFIFVILSSKLTGRHNMNYEKNIFSINIEKVLDF